MWSRYAYIPFLFYGFLFEADARFGNALRRHWRGGLILGLGLLFAGLGGLVVLYSVGIDPLTEYGLWSVLWRASKGIDGWLVVITILGLAGRARRRQDEPEPDHDARLQPPRPRPAFVERVADYVGEAQLPFYVLHMAPIVIIGFYVVQWPASALVKYMVISLASFAVTLAVYDIGIRRTGLTRFLFGMKAQGRSIVAGKMAKDATPVLQPSEEKHDK
jgi:hypothetical protein